MTYKSNSTRAAMRIKQDASGKPDKFEGKVSSYLSQKAMKDLVATSITFTASPYEAALPNQQPYPILNIPNKRIGAWYVGDKNLDGSNVMQYANSYNTGFLDYPDTFVLNVGLNYRYIPVNTTSSITTGEGNDARQVLPGQKLVDNMIQSIDEVTSRLDSSTFTNLNINRYLVVTSLPMGSNSPTKEITLDGKTVEVYYNIADVIYAASMVYQQILQNYTLQFNNYNSFRLKMGEMIRMEYNRNATKLNSFFGLINKASFRSLWNSLSINLFGEYIDVDFMKQVNTMLLTPSRKSESIIDPLLEINGYINMPDTFKLILISGSVDEPTYQVVFDLESTEFSPFKTNCIKLGNYLTAESTLEWVRGATDTTMTEQARFNNIVGCIENLTSCISYFKKSFIDLRTVFDVFERSDINNWDKYLRLGVIKDDDCQIFDNLLINDIYKLAMSGAVEIEFNNTTKRFSTYSMWNIYTGIPDYDVYSGGAFLTFSLKDITLESKDDDYTIEYIPIGLYLRANSGNISCFGCTRNGSQVLLNSTKVTMSSDVQLARLVPLNSQSSYEINVPYFTMNNATDNAKSCCYRAISSIFGYCRYGNSGTTLLDPDILAIYQIEIADFTNEMITYSRQYAPFRTISGAKDSLGFLGIAPKLNK